MIRAFFTRRRSLFAKIAAVLLALAVWQAVAMAIGEELILVTPLAVFLRLFSIWREAGFFTAVFHSLLRITLGFLAALLLGTLLAVPAGKYPAVETLLSPYMVTVKAVPVVSFIVLAYVWFPPDTLPAFIAFLIVLPAVNTNLLAAIKSIDGGMKEMTELFGVSFPRRLFTVYLPHMRPFALSACALAAGLAWKSGVAAEIMTMPKNSMGNLVYIANLWLASVDLYTYTVIIVLLSVVFEKLFSLLLRKSFDGLERLTPCLFGKPTAKQEARAREITLHSLCKRFGENGVIEDLSLTFEAGRVTCIMAPSGKGKTTLLRLIAGLETPDGGFVRGNEGKISMVFQEDRLSARLHAIENAMLGRRGASPKEAKAILCELGLGEHLEKPVSALSGGMCRRVAIARALLSDAPLLLLDEPLKGLDGETKASVAAVIRRHTEGKTVLAVTHDEEDAALLGAAVVSL